MKQLLRLLRPKHYLKNLLVFLPLFFGGRLTNTTALGQAGLTFAAFCLLASSVYVFNDLCDRARDRCDPLKCTRPLASGAVRPAQAALLAAVLLALTAGLAHLLPGNARLCLLAYALSNLAYSLELKNIPLLDTALLAFGFLLRVLAGAAAAGVRASGWLCLTVLFLSLYMSFGKRRSELRRGFCTRGSARLYTDVFLTRAMRLCLAAALGGYALWCLLAATSLAGRRMLVTLPLTIWICLHYDRCAAQGGADDPVELLLHDHVLLLLSALYLALTAFLLYVL